MPVVSGSTLDVARNRASRVTFKCLAHHQSEIPGGMVSTRSFTVVPDVDGVITSPELEPGPLTVIVDGVNYDVTLGPDDVDLWTLIAAAVGAPPGTSTDALRDAVSPLLEANLSTATGRAVAFSIALGG